MKTTRLDITPERKRDFARRLRKKWKSFADYFFVGQVFGRLKILRLFRIANRLHARCECKCGKKKTVYSPSLKDGSVKSCGCLSFETRSRLGKSWVRHGMFKSKIYGIWSAMKSRCSKPSDPNFKNYGGRGINVCNRWLKFDNFFEDMGHRPDGRTLERTDNNKGYSKENCRWATRKEQARNNRHCHYVNFRGRSMPIIEAAEIAGVEYGRFRRRIVDQGLTPEQAAA